MTRLVGTTETELQKLLGELEEGGFLQHIRSCLDELGMNHENRIRWGSLFYVLVRVLRPKVTVETGVANGVSSSFFLRALARNGNGVLYSFDLHCREGLTVPKGKKLGWIVPDYLKSRWRLVLGESTRQIPKLIKEMKGIDIFLHDSSHIYETMMGEYTLVWPHLNFGGILLSDDAYANDAFLDFSQSVGLAPVCYQGVCAIRKI